MESFHGNGLAEAILSLGHIIPSEPIPLDFFWEHIKNVVYIPPLPTTLPEIAGRIQAPAATVTRAVLINLWTELWYTYTCRATHGAHIDCLSTVKRRAQNSIT